MREEARLSSLLFVATDEDCRDWLSSVLESKGVSYSDSRDSRPSSKKLSEDSLSDEEEVSVPEEE